MRTIGVVTTARADYGIYRPVLRRIQHDADLRLSLLVCGMHLSRDFGFTVDEIVADGFPIDERIDMLEPSDAPEGIARSIGRGVMGFAEVFTRRRPDLLLVLGDRFEMFAAATAALPFGIPIGHLHGGEATEGLIDEAIRHSLTKMSHLHFVSTERYRARVIQLGEEPWRVVVSGAPSLDNLATFSPLSAQELSARIGLPLDPPPLIVTFHPVTLEFEDTGAHIAALAGALRDAGRPVVFTYPNADTRGRVIIDAIDDYVRSQGNAVAVASLGTAAYFSLMRHAAAMIGNSSSGIIEAASFGLPVVNIGTRQRGRAHGANVIDVECSRRAIAAAIAHVTEPEFREQARTTVNLYGDGSAAEGIVSAIKSVPLDRELTLKRFHDIEPQYT